MSLCANIIGIMDERETVDIMYLGLGRTQKQS